jgi:hypothetical protein
MPTLRRTDCLQSWIDHHRIAFFLEIFFLLWCMVGYITSSLGGWFWLARRFRYRGKFSGPTWRWQTGRLLGVGHYNRCLIVGANEVGMYLAVTLPFRAGHPPLFIPWDQISFVDRTRMMFLRAIRFELGKDEPIPLTIYESLAKKLKAAAGNRWPAG